MNSKKIIAAAMSAMLATSAVASMASADDASNVANDDYTLELLPGTRTVVNGYENTTAHITATLKSDALENLLATSTSVSVTAAKMPKLAKYTLPSGIATTDVLATNAAATEMEAAAGKYAWINSKGDIQAVVATTGVLDTSTVSTVEIKGGITEGYKLVKITKSATSGAGVTGSIVGTEYSVVASFGGFGNFEDSANPYNKLAMGLNFKDFTVGGVTNNVIDWADFSMTNIVMKSTVTGKGDNYKPTNGSAEVENNVVRNASGTSTFDSVYGGANPVGVLATKADNSDQTAKRYVSKPKGMNLAFGINANQTLTSIDYDEAVFTLDFDVSMSNEHWKALVLASNLGWDEVPGQDWWDNLDFENLLNEKAEDLLNVFFGINGSCVVDWATTNAPTDTTPLQVSGLNMTDMQKALVSDYKEGEKKADGTEQLYFNSSSTYDVPDYSLHGMSYMFDNYEVPVEIRSGITNQAVFANLNNGGTVTFTFDQEFRRQDSFTPYLLFKTFGGLVNPPIHLEYVAKSADNKSITFSFPAGLTWDDGTTNPFKNFTMYYNLGYINTNAAQANNGSMVASSASLRYYEGDDYMSYFDRADSADDGHLIKITFKANGAPDAPSVDGDNSNSGSQGGNTQNPGSTSGNPNTGIALAVAPIVLAAGAVVTIASKKRK